MKNITVINKYIALFDNRREEIEAQSIHEAKRIALKLFKLNKDDEPTVLVILAEVGINEVTHAPTF